MGRKVKKMEDWEMKTIKEIFTEQLLEERGFKPLRDELREEAIRWIKAIKSGKTNPTATEKEIEK